MADGKRPSWWGRRLAEAQTKRHCVVTYGKNYLPAWPR